jgi:uncharacterized protein YbjT (DUF2867 family)
MNIENICILGGSGFVGGHLCEQLAARGYRLRVPTRRSVRAKHLTVLPTLEVVEADIHGTASFQQAHVELARKVVSACRERGVQRLLHMSALNADPRGPSEYLRTKGEAEAIVGDSGLAYTIFRPSVVAGPGDRFLRLFARMQRVLPVVVLAAPDARFQPVYVEDVAGAFVAALEDPVSIRAAYDLCGPKVYTLRELVQLAGEVSGHRRPVVGLGPRLSCVQAGVLEVLPGKLMSRDNLRSMQIDSVCSSPFPFGMQPTPLEAVAHAWLAPQSPRTRFQRFRDSARRSTGP